MNRQHPDSAGLPTPTAMRPGEDRFVRRHTVDRVRRQNRGNVTEPAGTDTHHRAATGITALDQAAPIVVRHVQIGVSDQAAQQQSP